MSVVSFSELRKDLKKIMDRSLENHEKVIITRQNQEPMVLLPLRDFEAITETLYLLSTESNRQHLRQSLKEIQEGKIKHIQKLLDPL